MSEAELQQISQRIEAAGADWVPRITWISELPRPEVATSFGFAARPEDIDEGREAFLSARAHEAAVALPSKIDWRANRGNWVTPVKDQGRCGSCVSFATCAALESLKRISSEDPGLEIDLSEADLFFCGCGPCCDRGWLPRAAMERARDEGVTYEAQFPYRDSDQNCAGPYPIAMSISSFSELWGISERKAAIVDEGPVVAGMEVYEDFLYYGGGVYRHVYGAYSGLHAVCIIGFDDEKQCWIAKNSWGTGWGDDGFFEIAYGEALLDSSFAFFSPRA